MYSDEWLKRAPVAELRGELNGLAFALGVLAGLGDSADKASAQLALNARRAAVRAQLAARVEAA